MSRAHRSPGAHMGADLTRLSWTMRGTWLSAHTPDSVRPAELRLAAQRPLVGQLLRGRLRVRGTLDLDGWLAAAPVDGSVELVRGLRPGVRYSLTVDAQPPLRLDFALRPRLSQPVDSVTRLWAEIAGPSGAKGLLHLRFDVRRDLAPHLLAALRGAPYSLG